MFDEFDFIFEFELMVEVEFECMFPAVPDVFEVVVLMVDELFAVLVVVDIVFVVAAVFAVLARFVFEVLFAVSPPKATPRAAKARRPDSAMIFFIKYDLLYFSKITYCYFYTARRSAGLF